MQLFKKKAYTLCYPNECENCTPHDVIIGTQTWTGCNLNVTTYRDGTTIPQVTDPTAWLGLTTGAWCYYQNDTANGPVYGKLYNWYAVNDTLHGGLAPVGYHIPTTAEWTTLINYAGGLDVAGGKLKEIGLCHWLTPNTDATDDYGFAALPGGSRDYDAVFYNKQYVSTWWSSSEVNSIDAWGHFFNWNTNNAYTFDYAKISGFSIRLVKDVVTPTPLSFTLSQTCSGSNVTLVANTITGGTGPYQISTGTFANQLDAEANTSWVTATTRNFTLGNVTGEYWVAVKDSTGDILSKEIYADCWSITANRDLGYRSLSGNISSSTTCGYTAEAGTNNLYVAVHTPGTLAIGDRVFLADLPGTAFFDGSTGSPSYTPKYWKMGLNTEFSPCTGDGTVARINKYGVIEDLICCP